MSKANVNEVVDKARDYYDSSDADEFYYRIWGGEDIHVGIYGEGELDIRRASHRTVQRMAKEAPLHNKSRVLDIGAGYGGSARYLAKTFGCHLTCLNLSGVQNTRNREMNTSQGLSHQIEVVDGNFEELPFDDHAFDLVWCQDAILHSGNRRQVFVEVDRVLSSPGQFIFTDPMQKAGVEQAALQPVLDRIHLASLGSVEDYAGYAEEMGWSVDMIEEHPEQLVRHYCAVLHNLDERSTELDEIVSPEYIQNMKKGLRHWIEAGNRGLLNWGILNFTK